MTTATMSTASPEHHTQFDTAAPEPLAMSPEQAGASSEAAILRTARVMIVGGILLLASISAWLWYGMHHYQNCL